MSDCIDREKLLERIDASYCKCCRDAGGDYHGIVCRACRLHDAIVEIEDAPAVDVPERQSGCWAKVKSLCVCPFCKTVCQAPTAWTEYCSHCGARLRWGEPEYVIDAEAETYE